MYGINKEMKKIWEEEELEIWVKPYKVFLVNENSGLIEFIKNTKSIHEIKKKESHKKNYFLKTYFQETFKGDFKKAQNNFLVSTVGYSLVTYFLQLKDRHNGNILINEEGHLLHVDFGFILGKYPGFYPVEKAPFKFPTEYFTLLEDLIDEFKTLFFEGFLALRKYSQRLSRIIEIMMSDGNKRCDVLEDFKMRFKLELGDKDLEEYVMNLINSSINSRTTTIYDSFQYYSNGYYM